MALSMQIASTFVPQDFRPYAFEPGVAQHNRDLLAPYGVKFDENLARKGRNFAFGTLAERLISEAPGRLPEPDLLILTYALPDPHSIEKTVSCHLNHLLGGRARSFAISEQGLAAPFTALRIADAYARSGRCHSLALFVLEQATFPYREPFVDEGGLVDSGVLLFFGATGEWEVTALHAVTSRDRLSGLLRGLAWRAARDVLLVAGPWAEHEQGPESGSSCYRIPPGSYCTSVWLEFARRQQDWATDYQTVVLYDTDPRIGISQVAVLTRRTASAAARAEGLCP